MKTYTYSHFKNNIAKIFEMVKSGEEIVVSEGKGKEKIALILPYKKHKLDKQRPIGILKGKATFRIKDDFKMTDDELLNS